MKGGISSSPFHREWIDRLAHMMGYDLPFGLGLRKVTGKKKSQVLTARSPRPSVEVAARCVWEIMGYRDIKTNRKVIVLNKLRDELEVMTTVMSYSLSHL